MNDIIVVNPGCHACESLKGFIQRAQGYGHALPVPLVTLHDERAMPMLVAHDVKAYPSAIIGGKFIVGAGAIRRALATTYGFRT